MLLGRGLGCRHQLCAISPEESALKHGQAQWLRVAPQDSGKGVAPAAIHLQCLDGLGTRQGMVTSWHPYAPAPSCSHGTHRDALEHAPDPGTAPCSLPCLDRSHRGARATHPTPTPLFPSTWRGRTLRSHTLTSLYSLIQYSLPATWSRLSPTGSSMDTTASSCRFEPSMPAAAMTVRPLSPRLTQYRDLGAGTKHPFHSIIPETMTWSAATSFTQEPRANPVSLTPYLAAGCTVSCSGATSLPSTVT